MKEILRDIWPGWCRDHPWLVDFLERVEKEATRFGQDSVYFHHVAIAFADMDGDPNRFLKEANVDVSRWRDRIIFGLGYNDGMDVYEFQKYPNPGQPPKRTDRDVIEVLEFAVQEATAAKDVVDARHLFVAIANFGVEGTTPAKARKIAGLSSARRVLASDADRSLIYRPKGIAPMILCGGDERPVLKDAIELSRHGGTAKRKARVTLVFIESIDRDVAWVESAGATPIDSGLYRREDAFSPEVIQRLSDSDVICFPGGYPEPKYEALVATPALRAISEASDQGAVILGNSAGAMIWGVGVLSRWESFDELEPLPMLSWLDKIVVLPHYRGWLQQEDQLHALVKAFPGALGVGVGQKGAVVAEPGWQSVRSLRTWGEYPSVRLNSPDDGIEVID